MENDPFRIQIQNADPNKKADKDDYEEVSRDLEWILKLNEKTARI